MVEEKSRRQDFDASDSNTKTILYMRDCQLLIGDGMNARGTSVEPVTVS